MNKVIEFIHVSKQYKDHFIIEDLNLVIEQGEFVTIIGSSGAGKTTVLKMINQLIEPTSGEILINNKEVTNLIQLRRTIGYVPQGSILFPHLTIEQNINYVPSLDKQVEPINIDTLLDTVSLERSIKERYPDELSGGQRQRVAIARALASGGDLLLMDEPFSAVDEITRTSLQNELKQLHTSLNKTIILVTHSVEEAFKLGSKVLIFNEGKIEQYDTPEMILTNPNNDYVKSLLMNLKER